MSTTRRIARRAYSRVSSDFGAANVERVLLYGAVLVGGYLVLKTLNFGANVAGAVKGATDRIGSAIGTGLYDLFHPNAAERATSTQYIVWFQDEGLTHAVDSLDVDSQGFFKRGGKRYRIVIDPKGVLDKNNVKRNKVAIRA